MEHKIKILQAVAVKNADRIPSWVARLENSVLGRKRLKHYRGCLLRAFGYKAMPEMSLYWTQHGDITCYNFAGGVEDKRVVELVIEILN